MCSPSTSECRRLATDAVDAARARFDSAEYHAESTGKIPYVKKQLTDIDYDAFEALVTQRRSVRWYEERLRFRAS